MVTTTHIYGVFINTTAGDVLLPISKIPVRLLPKFMESIQVGHIQQVCIDGWDATRNSWKVSHPEFVRPSGASPTRQQQKSSKRVIWATKNYALLDINGFSGFLHKSKTIDPKALTTGVQTKRAASEFFLGIPPPHDGSWPIRIKPQAHTPITPTNYHVDLNEVVAATVVSHQDF